MRREGALVHIGTRDAITRKARGARAGEGTGTIGTIVDVEAIVCTRGALIDLRASRVRSEVAALAGACAVHKMWRLCRAREAIRRGRAAAGRAATVACGA